jgi:hypothetical protein
MEEQKAIMGLEPLALAAAFTAGCMFISVIWIVCWIMT